jgi:hypothetical protein
VAKDFAGVPDDVRTKITHGNAAGLYKVPVAA